MLGYESRPIKRLVRSTFVGLSLGLEPLDLCLIRPIQAPKACQETTTSSG